MHLSPGDRVEFILGEDNVIRMLPRLASVKRLKGMLPKPDQAVTLEQMDDAIADAVSAQ